MDETLKKQLILGAILASAAGAYIYFTKDDEESIFDGLNGLSIDLKPNNLIDSAVEKFIPDEALGRGAKHLAKKLSYSVLR